MPAPSLACRTLSALAVAACFGAVALLAGASPAAAWTPKCQVTIAEEAVRLAPPDFYGVIDRHRAELRKGAIEPFRDGDPGRHMKNADGSGSLDRVIEEEVEAAVEAIRQHQPFADIVFQLGVVSHYVADADNPLNTSAADPQEGLYFADYLRYMESAAPRFPLVFYGLRAGLERQPNVSAVVAQALARGRALYPLIGTEYRRIAFQQGVTAFDDRSTAFGVASISFSHAVSDVAVVLRYIWIRAGGADDRSHLPAGGELLIELPRHPQSR